MRRLVMMAFGCLIGTMFASAQECKLCGDWHSSKESIGEMGYIQFHMRIKKSGDKYYIRVKNDVIKNGETSTNYWENEIAYSPNGRNINWESHSFVDDEWNDGERLNGTLIRKAIHYRVCSAYIEDEVLHFQFRVRIDYYGNSNNLIGSKWAGDIVIHDLFNDDDDW